MQIIMKPIGVIHSPYKEPEGMPIQGTFKPEVEAWVELEDEYSVGLTGLEGFSHAIIIYYFHKSNQEQIECRPFLEDEIHGIFAIRSPHRPNHIGLSVVKISRIEGNRLYFTKHQVLQHTGGFIECPADLEKKAIRALYHSHTGNLLPIFSPDDKAAAWNNKWTMYLWAAAKPGIFRKGYYDAKGKWHDEVWSMRTGRLIRK